MDNNAFSENERFALELLRRHRGLLVSKIPDRNEKCAVLGDSTPGRGVYNKLIKRGLCLETEEPILEDGFQFTPTMELTEEGEKVAEKLFNPPSSARRTLSR